MAEPQDRRSELEREMDGKIDQLRADAQALETAARILDAFPPLPRARAEQTAEALFAMAAGMRLAADRMPHSSDCPF